MNVCHHAVGTMVKLILAPWCGQHNVVIHIHLRNVVERISQTVILGQLRNYVLNSVNFNNLCGANDPIRVSMCSSATLCPVLDTVQK